jgi:hypothetical protein
MRCRNRKAQRRWYRKLYSLHRSQELVPITNQPIEKPGNCTTQGCN